MSLFNRTKQPEAPVATNASPLAEMALNTIQDGVIITDRNGMVKFINPSAVTMTDCGNAANALRLTYDLLLKMESKEGRELSETENPLIQAMKTGQPLEKFAGCLIAGASAKRIPIAVSVAIDNNSGNRIITFRNITKELAEEGEQSEFISTASHEMRTPVASIEGYLSLALNPQTATIDARAKGYLDAAHQASKHLGKLFQDLLDATKLDDGHIRPHFEPVEMVGAIKQICDPFMMQAKNAKLTYQFGANKEGSSLGGKRINQVVYGFVDLDFMREIMGNLIDNAIKYTPEGGSIYVNVLGDGDRVLINVTDTGIGISADDLQHIFQKFYRADNSDTRTIGGTGLGLYLVKQRVEAMGGRVWAESAFGEGSTFYVSLPRITGEEYERRRTIIENTAAMQINKPQVASDSAGVVPTVLSEQFSQTQSQPAPQPVPGPQPMPEPQPIPRPEQPPAPPAQAPVPTPEPAPPTPTPAPGPTIMDLQNNNNNSNGGTQ
jgi:signal transduction histidine kinase